eukprot:XP_001703698.1 predicted protein [Chlamydomonas reinhardtii]
MLARPLALWAGRTQADNPTHDDGGATGCLLHCVGVPQAWPHWCMWVKVREPAGDVAVAAAAATDADAAVDASGAGAVESCGSRGFRGPLVSAGVAPSSHGSRCISAAGRGVSTASNGEQQQLPSPRLLVLVAMAVSDSGHTLCTAYTRPLPAYVPHADKFKLHKSPPDYDPLNWTSTEWQDYLRDYCLPTAGLSICFFLIGLIMMVVLTMWRLVQWCAGCGGCRRTCSVGAETPDWLGDRKHAWVKGWIYLLCGGVLAMVVWGMLALDAQLIDAFWRAVRRILDTGDNITSQMEAFTLNTSLPAAVNNVSSTLSDTINSANLTHLSSLVFAKTSLPSSSALALNSSALQARVADVVNATTTLAAQLNTGGSSGGSGRRVAGHLLAASSSSSDYATLGSLLAALASGLPALAAANTTTADMAQRLRNLQAAAADVSAQLSAGSTPTPDSLAALQAALTGSSSSGGGSQGLLSGSDLVQSLSARVADFRARVCASPLSDIRVRGKNTPVSGVSSAVNSTSLDAADQVGDATATINTLSAVRSAVALVFGPDTGLLANITNILSLLLHLRLLQARRQEQAAGGGGRGHGLVWAGIYNPTSPSLRTQAAAAALAKKGTAAQEAQEAQEAQLRAAAKLWSCSGGTPALRPVCANGGDHEVRPGRAAAGGSGGPGGGVQELQAP